jgi:hypothetical protein
LEERADSLDSNEYPSIDADDLHQRDEGEALEMAVQDLRRLDRYERRAAARMRWAIMAFIEVKQDQANADSARRSAQPTLI